MLPGILVIAACTKPLTANQLRNFEGVQFVLEAAPKAELYQARYLTSW